MIQKQKKLVGLLVGLLMMMQNTGLALASNQLIGNSGDIGLIAECATTLPPKYQKELQNFLIFLDETFKNKSSNTSLTNIAIQRYAQYKQAIRGIWANLGPAAYALVDGPAGIDVDAPKAIDSTAELAAYKKCQEITEEYIVQGKDQMMERIKSSSAQKSATVMLEKYKAINMKLRELNLQIAKMYGMFMTFANKFQGFLPKCVR